MVLSIVIPAYNEATTIHLILDKIHAVQLDGEFKKKLLWLMTVQKIIPRMLLPHML